MSATGTVLPYSPSVSWPYQPPTYTYTPPPPVKCPICEGAGNVRFDAQGRPHACAEAHKKAERCPKCFGYRTVTA